MDPAIVLQVGMPLLLGIGGLVAWRKTMSGSNDDEAPGWHDDSLDDWREEREAQREAERQARANGDDKPPRE